MNECELEKKRYRERTRKKDVAVWDGRRREKTTKIAGGKKSRYFCSPSLTLALLGLKNLDV
jgi:hypothetical protein